MAAVDWLALVDHRHFVRADEPLERVHHQFQTNDVGFMAVLDGERPIGLCARHEVGMRLGSQYGFSLFGKTPVSRHLVREPLIIRCGQPWAEVLQRVFSRTGEQFNEDVLLVDEAGRFRGLISMQTLVRLQTRLLMQSIARLEQQQAEICRRNRQMTEDLLMAREMQLAMLRRELPQVASGGVPGRGAVEVLSHYAPLSVVSGDFYEVLAVSDTALGIMIADVMGHGVQAALVTAMMRALIQTYSATLANNHDPGAFLTALNGNLCGILDSCRLPMFASAFALVADVATGSLSFANAGHPCPLLLRRTANQVLALECDEQSNGGLLGVTGAASYSTGRMSLATGDLVLLYTDGLFEVEGADGEILGQDGLARFAARHLARPGQELIERLVESVREFSSQGRFQDDVCLVGLEIREIFSPSPAR
ncbi:Protein serine/threonine phosphatase [Candidatus Methylocalor cossyra]|uniref:Protein serine/threonine phosphatase n=2 Tax=Candidatus Methylocalor cossyra TaxID=3108543 RepID=A0ABP1C5Y3_9GAMM